MVLLNRNIKQIFGYVTKSVGSLAKRSACAKKMESGIKKFLLGSFFLCLLISASCASSDLNESDVERKSEKAAESVTRLFEEGRTMVHHTVKRFLFILPAIFFKLGIAFTMLIIVTLVSVNNGFIGFLLLVVGLSSVLARLQQAQRPSVLPYYNPLPPYHHHLIDRSDNGVTEAKSSNVGVATTQAQTSYDQYQYYKPLSTYNPSYYGQKIA